MQRKRSAVQGAVLLLRLSRAHDAQLWTPRSLPPAAANGARALQSQQGTAACHIAQAPAAHSHLVQALARHCPAGGHDFRHRVDYLLICT